MDLLTALSTKSIRFSPRRRTRRRQATASGQSLVEFVLVMPILILVMVAGGMLGIGSYKAHMASSAIQQPTTQKLKFSSNRDAIPMATLQTAANKGDLAGTLDDGDLIDTIQVVDSDPYTSLMVGSKEYKSSISFIPGFTLRVGQVINRNLLQPANAGSAVVHPKTAWVPNGSPVPPPW